MKVAYLDKDGFSIRSENMPSVSGHQVLVKTVGCGICGGDQHLYRVKDQEIAEEPLRLGHEGTGTVVSIGSDVRNFAVGDMVTSLSGGFADYFVASEDDLIIVPDGVDPLLALGEPVACCVHACERTSAKPGHRVAVLGCGFMGLICLQLMKIDGASEIIAFDPIEYRREAAMKLGATSAYHPDDYSFADPDIGEFDIVIEAVGNQATIDLSTDIVKQHGKVNLVGYHESGGGMRSIHMKRWNFKAIDVVNGHVRRDDEKHAAMTRGIDLIAEGKLRTDLLVKTYALDDIEQAFQDLTQGNGELFKIVLTTGNT